MQISCMRRGSAALAALALVILAGCGGSSASNGSGYTTFVSPTFGYSIAIPSQLHLVQGSSPGQPTSGGQSSAGAPPSTGGNNNQNTQESPIFQGGNKTSYMVTMSVNETQVSVQQFCSQGTPIKVNGIAARQIEHLQPATNSGANQPPGLQPSQPTMAGQASISAQFIYGGVYYFIQLSGTPTGQNFLTAYNGMWQHMLASFKPGKTVNATTVTCAS